MFTGNSVILIPLSEENLSKLFIWRNKETFLRFCTTRKSNVDISEFESEISEDFEKDSFCQMMICKKSTNKIVGTVYSYNLNIDDGYVFVTVYVCDEFSSFGYGAEAFGLFCVHLFETVSEPHKIYVEVYEYNKRSLSCLKKSGFVEEGRFKEHRLYEGIRYDLIRLAFFRRNLEQMCKTLKSFKK